MGKTQFCRIGLLAGWLLCQLAAIAQVDTSRPQTLDSFLLRRKGLIGNLAKNLLVSQPGPGTGIQRNDLRFLPFQGKSIRHIYIQSLDFGVSIGDTTKRLQNRLTHWINDIHYDTREYVIRNNLFFREGNKLIPELMGLNERHLRDLSFIQEASILVHPVADAAEVDITVLTKDAFSLSGGVKVGSMEKGEIRVREDNFLGNGDRLQADMFYDRARSTEVGWGAEFARHNIGGSFIDAYAGYKNFQRSFTSGRPEEGNIYFGLIRPLHNPFMKWTYAGEVSIHNTVNRYATDSLYRAGFKYRYSYVDLWAGWNLSAGNPVVESSSSKINWLIGSRIFRKHFSERPDDHAGKFFYRYVDFTGLLGALSVFRQSFYKTTHIYGFGRNEDVPEGVEASLIAGWTQKNDHERPYLGIDYQRYFFTPSQQYISYAVRAGSYWYRSGPEDVNLLVSFDYFSKLHLWGPKWKQRGFIKGSFGRQLQYRFNEPLLLESDYGLRGYRNDATPGDLRASIRGESVFFSPWSLLYFKLAPVIFGSATYFRFDTSVQTKRIYTSIGGGLRIQNESLIFGTMEVKATYFPRPDITRERWRLDFNTNLRYRFNRIFIKRPELISVN